MEIVLVGLGGKKNLRMSVLRSKDFHCLLRVSHSAVTAVITMCKSKDAVFFLSKASSFLTPFPPPTSSSMLFVQTRRFPSLHVQILNLFLPSSGKHTYTHFKRGGSERQRQTERTSTGGYRSNQAANIC